MSCGTLPTCGSLNLARINTYNLPRDHEVVVLIGSLEERIRLDDVPWLTSTATAFTCTGAPLLLLEEY